jgi:F-type H+-transporting ATPase subunit alpha
MASIRADEITKILRAQIANYDQSVAVDEVGTVISVGDGIARVHGLEKVMAGEMLEFPHDVFGIALNLEEDQVGTVLLGEYTAIEEGDTVKRTRSIMSATAKGLSSPTSAFLSNASRPALWTASLFGSRYRPVSKPSTP